MYNEANGGKNGNRLTGDKFILRTGSNATSSVQRNFYKRNYENTKMLEPKLKGVK